MEILEKITLKQAILYALIGALVGLLLQIVSMLNYFNIYSLGNAIAQGSLALFFYVLYKKQKGE